ncbi:type II toxin-antitoxin system prevent-host-death family antitoxin [Glutamicibacter sp. V16R2B1]|uniref:type II toxin-antitoxin system Phd/YefM family antitoxin n=1 Tax=Glutamicibacter sp. V16R2B1 TaxID=2036207 RepID=UPI0010FE7DB8|nr:type II toxin-antitoxin system prevent-host-death family antitoxin [Glutamicibacter sp. V16R2B1]MCK9901307.1 type II toxin-antitoxin system prevent-host-death family antitoxin [Frankia sp. Cpl3]TLK47996.1 type II toxin-antitoxin system prevent-host-death family antitoxin [Glutamicibacter sp. V16R2B1]
MNPNDIEIYDVTHALFEQAAAGDEFTVAKHGEPVAVVIGWDRWQEIQTALREG